MRKNKNTDYHKKAPENKSKLLFTGKIRVGKNSFNSPRRIFADFAAVEKTDAIT